MGICHPKPSPPKTPLDDDDALPLVDTRPPEYSAGPPPARRQDIFDRGHHRRLKAVATSAATLAAEGGFYDPATRGGPTLDATALVNCVMAIASVRGRTKTCVRHGCLPSALPEMNALFLAGDPVGKIVDAALDMMLY